MWLKQVVNMLIELLPRKTVVLWFMHSGYRSVTTVGFGFDHAARRPDGVLIKDLHRLARNAGQTGGLLKAWTTTTKAALEPLSGPKIFGYYA